MPSLNAQLKQLQAPVSRSLGVEKAHASLLFDPSEAAALSGEVFLQLGVNGIEQLRRFDRGFADYALELFEESALSINRAQLSKEENVKLSETLDRLIIELSPYFHQHGCKQILEWLIHKYQIHLHNSHLLISAFLVYHSSNSFGRLLKITRLTGPEWEFTNEYSLSALPIPFTSIVRACVKGGQNFFLVGTYSQFLQHAIKIVGEEYADKHMQQHFTFYTSLIVHLSEDPKNINEQLVSRLLPHVATALRSKMTHYKLSGMMIVCDLVMNATLNENILHELIKLCLIKMSSEHLLPAMNTIFVICQRQALKSLPQKSLFKLLQKSDELALSEFLVNALTKSELTGFVVPFVNTLLDSLSEPKYQKLAVRHLAVVLNLETMTDAQAFAIIRGCIDKVLSREGGQIPLELTPVLRQIAMRFASTFDAIRAEQALTGAEHIGELMKQCKIATHEVAPLVLHLEPEPKRKRRRTNSARSVEDAPATAKAKPTTPGPLANLQADGEKRKKFKKEPSVIIDMLGSAKPDREELEWALASMSNTNYLNKQSSAMLENYYVEAIKYVARNPEGNFRSAIRHSLISVPISPSLLFNSITHASAPGTAAKRSRNTHAAFDEDETDTQFCARIVFVLEVLNSSAAVVPTKEAVNQLFNTIEITERPPPKWPPCKEVAPYVQQLAIMLLVKWLKSPEGVMLVDESSNFEALVNMIRFTSNQTLLRNALQLLTAVASRIPVALTCQVMSLFAFMGNGLIKKDNELTLTVIEEALHALLSTILSAQPAHRRERLLEVSRVFAKALVDIPAHRRPRILRSLASCVDAADLWLVVGTLFEEVCAQWQTAQTKRRVEFVDDVCVDYAALLPAEQQLTLALDLLDYTAALGGDAPPPAAAAHERRQLIFDRKKHTMVVLRHYRYMIINFVLRIVDNKSILSQLAAMSDDEIYTRVGDVGVRMLETMSRVGKFVNVRLASAQRSAATDSAKALKYWLTLSARVDAIMEKLRCLLPSNVSGHLVCDLLERDSLDARTRDAALQLLNTKLINECAAEASASDSALTTYLEKLAATLNAWLQPHAGGEGAERCQKAAHTLKMLVKRTHTVSSQPVFAQTIEHCIELLGAWASLNAAMLASILLLVAELVRAPQLRAALLVHLDTVCNVTAAILEQQSRAAVGPAGQLEERASDERQAALPSAAVALAEAAAPGRRKRASSSGRQHGGEGVFICALTLTQRLIENAHQHIRSHLGGFIELLCHLSAAYLPPTDTAADAAAATTAASNGEHAVAPRAQSATHKLATIREQLSLIRAACASTELHPLTVTLQAVATAVARKPLRLVVVAQLVNLALENADTEAVADVLNELVALFFDMLSVRQNCSRKTSQESLQVCERETAAAFTAMAENCAEVQLTPVFSELADWVTEALVAGADGKTRARALTVYHLANAMYEKFNTLALPYFGQLFAYTPKLLRRLNASTSNANELLIAEIGADSQQAHLVDRLITTLLTFVANCAKHTVFMGEDRAEVVYEAIIDEIDNHTIEGHEARCLPHVADCVLRLAESAPDLFVSSMCQRLLDKMRSPQARVRLRALHVFERVLARVRDALAPVLPAVAQHFGELAEDTNKRVSRKAAQVLKQLHEIFGEDTLAAA